MALAFIEDSTLTAIADAIRGKTGGTEGLYPSQWCDELDNIQGSGKYLWSKRESSDGDIIGYAVDDDLSAYPDGDTQDGYYWEVIGLIKFTICGGGQYYATDGMTWAEYVESEHNPVNEETGMKEFAVDSYSGTVEILVVMVGADPYYSTLYSDSYQDDEVYGTDLIISGHEYC